MASKKVDNTRDLAPMTDPIAYRESYSENDIIKDPSDLIIYQEGKPINLGGETAGSTVSQNNQSNAQNQNGTSGKYDGTDGKGNITVGPQNANLNYYQYGDDSNPHQQGQKGGMNDKYTGEGVSNSYIEYNPDITLADLDPNYLYGENARQQNRKEAGYIARRNDMIASALYNEGKVSREEVANFLSQQNEWMNSTEADRLNTIESVWKRLGQIKPEQPEVDLSKAEDIVQDTSGKLYGKVTAEEGNPKKGIDTLADDNSVLRSMQESRVTTLQDFVSQDVSNIAVQIVEGTMTWSEQTWRDAQKYYPEFIAAVNAEVKRQRGQQNVNAIASGGEMNTTAANGQSNANNEIANFGVNNATGTKSSVEITKDVHNSLAQNQTANEASETMASIEEDMAILKNRLKNLREEANSKFKGDVPEYMVNAYISNKSQEIQNQMQILEDRYNAAYNRYKTEIAQTQWEKEYQLKQDQLQLERDEFKLKKWATEQGIEIDKAKLNADTDKSAKNKGDSFVVTTLSDEEISQAVDNLYEMFDSGQLGNAQCAAGIQKYYLPMLGITLPSLSSLERKKALINEDENYVPKRGDLIIINSGAKLEDGTPAGHIGIVLGVHKDGTVEYMDWNGKSNEKVAISGININNKSILGFRNVNKGQGQAINTDNKQFTDGEYEAFEKYLKSDLSKNDQAQLESRYGFEDDPEGMTNFVREALDNRPETNNIPDYSDKEWTDFDYDNFEAFLNPDKKTRMSKTEKEVMAEQYGLDVQGMTQLAMNALNNRPEDTETETLEPKNMTWVDYTGLTGEQISNIEREIGYNPNIEWELKKIIDKGIPTSGPAMQNVLKTVRAKDEEQLGQWIDHYQNKVNAEAVQAGEDILILLAQLQNNFKDAERVDEVTKDGKTKTVFDTNVKQGWGWGAIGIKYEQLINQLLLNKVTEAREKGATFGQMTEYEWKILEDAASALKIKFGLGSSDESFSEAFFDLVDATWKLTNGTNKGPTRSEWNSFVNQIRKDSEWYMTQSGEDGSNLGGSGGGTPGGAGTGGSNERTKEELFPSN